MEMEELCAEASKLLDSYFLGASDLSRLVDVQRDLESQCKDLQDRLQDARLQARQAAGKGSAQMEATAASLEALCNLCENRREESGSASKGVLVKELKDLAEEVSRVAEVRAYIEAVLQLERLVGDLEEGVYLAASTTPIVSSSKAALSQAASRVASAVDYLTSIETLMSDIVKYRPQWRRLTSAVDIRVDRTAAALRPVALADYRSILISIGWPPPLSKNSTKQTNPLLTMDAETKDRFCESFISLSRFQEVQNQRRRRDAVAEELSQTNRTQDPLWSIEELVNPITSAFDPHFKTWLHKPEFMFALAHKVAQQHVSAVDGGLQPLLDDELLAYSAKEEWVSDFVSTVSEHLRRFVLPTLAKDLDEESFLFVEASTVWLHTVDQTISFDSKMQALITGGSSGEYTSVFRLRQPCISVFAERTEWLALWTMLELKDVNSRLKADYDTESSWKLHGFASSPEFKAPLAAYKLTTAVSNVVDRCRTLPDPLKRLEFVLKTAIPILKRFDDELSQRCLEAEGLTSLADETSMLKVGVCLNAARYCENTLKEWSEDLFYLELRAAEAGTYSQTSQVEGSIFDAELWAFARFRSSWISKLVSVITRGFESRSREFFRNKKRWSEESITPYEVSAPTGTLVEALTTLQTQLTSLKGELDDANFIELWQRLAASIDQLVFQNVVLSGAKFSYQGVRHFEFDVKALFAIFRPYCARPASFFPSLSDSLRVLLLDDRDSASLYYRLVACEDEDEDAALQAVKTYGIRKMDGSLVRRIISLRL